MARKDSIRKIRKDSFFLSLPFPSSRVFDFFSGGLLKLPSIPWFKLLGFLLVISLELFLLQLQFLLVKSNI